MSNNKLCTNMNEIYINHRFYNETTKFELRKICRILLR